MFDFQKFEQIVKQQVAKQSQFFTDDESAIVEGDIVPSLEESLR